MPKKSKFYYVQYNAGKHGWDRLSEDFPSKPAALAWAVQAHDLETRVRVSPRRYR